MINTSSYRKGMFRVFLAAYFLLYIVPSTPFFLPETLLLLSFLTFVIVEDPDWSSWWQDSILFWLAVFCGWMSLTSLIDGFFLTGYYREWFEAGVLVPVLALFKTLLIRPLMVVFMLVHLLKDDSDQERLFIKGLLFLVLGKLLPLGYVDYIQNTGWLTGHHFTAYAHYNLTASLLNLFFPFILYEMYSANRLSTQFLWIVLFYANFNAVYMTQSRGGIIAMFFSLGVFGLIFLVSRFSTKNLSCTTALAVGVIFFAWINPAGDYTAKRFDKTQYSGVEDSVKKTLQTGSPVSGLSGRVTHIWPRTREVFLEQPWIGYTLDSYRNLMLETFGSELEFDPTHPHNFYLQLLFEGGIIGFILFHILAFHILRVPLRLFVESSFRLIGVVSVPVAVFSEVYFHGVVAMFDYHWLILIIPWVYVFREIDPGSTN
ncbi:MAG: O-antigen ligase family protein [bacterium]